MLPNPLVVATRHLSEALALGWRRWPSRILLVGMVVYTLGLAAAAVSPSIATLWMRRFHTDLPYPVWALMQPAPSMYSYENVATFQEGKRERSEVVNHHLYRVTSDHSYFWVTRLKKRGTLTLRSTYQGNTVETVYTIRKTDGGFRVER